MTCFHTDACPFCGGSLDGLPAEEGLIRAALRTGEEIFFEDGEGQPEFIGTAALLRHQ